MIRRTRLGKEAAAAAEVGGERVRNASHLRSSYVSFYSFGKQMKYYFRRNHSKERVRNASHLGWTDCHTGGHQLKKSTQILKSGIK